MKLLQNSTLSSIVVSILFIALFAGCGSDHDHGPTPIGIALSVNGTDIAMQEETTVTYATGNHIELSQGATLSPILVEFISEGGDRYLPDTNDGFFLQYSTSNSSVLSIGQVASANEWTVQLVGNSGGESTISFELMHVDHSDFESRPFQVRVNSVQPQ